MLVSSNIFVQNEEGKINDNIEIDIKLQYKWYNISTRRVSRKAYFDISAFLVNRYKSTIKFHQIFTEYNSISFNVLIGVKGRDL